MWSDNDIDYMRYCSRSEVMKIILFRKQNDITYSNGTYIYGI